MPRAPRRTPLLTALALTGALTLAACGDDAPPELARTVGDPSATAAPDPGQQTDLPEVDLEAAGRQLSSTEVDATLPEVSALPSGWAVDPDNILGDDDEEESGETRVVPERCRTVFESMQELNTAEPEAEGDVTFQESEVGPFVGASVSSFAEEVPEDRFDALVDGLSECREFSVEEAGEVTNLTVSPLSFPNLGEDSIALRFTGDTRGSDFTMDVVSIRVGHNLVGISQITLQGRVSSAEAFEEVARATMANLGST